MISLNKDIGAYGEGIAEAYLQKLGYIILERNFRSKVGEIDLIGKDGDFICFIEVKTRYGTPYGDPCEAVTFTKKLKLYKNAQMYIMKKRLTKYNFRFDVVEVILNNKDDASSIKLIKDAFQL